MRLFLDTSVLLAASGSARGASQFLVEQAAVHGWKLASSDYCEEETRRNLPNPGRSSAANLKNQVAPRIVFVRASFALDKPLVFHKAKDRPIVITALAARATWLLTLDEADFHTKLGREVYGLRIATPGEFLLEQRTAGLI